MNSTGSEEVRILVYLYSVACAFLPIISSEYIRSKTNLLQTRKSGCYKFSCIMFLKVFNSTVWYPTILV